MSPITGDSGNTCFFHRMIYFHLCWGKAELCWTSAGKTQTAERGAREHDSGHIIESQMPFVMMKRVMM